MNKDEVKNLIPGQVLRFTGDMSNIIVCFVKVSGTDHPVISWPNMDGGCPVNPEEIEVVDIIDLTPKQLRQYQTALWGAYRFYPEVKFPENI